MQILVFKCIKINSWWSGVTKPLQKYKGVPVSQWTPCGKSDGNMALMFVSCIYLRNIILLYDVLSVAIYFFCVTEA